MTTPITLPTSDEIRARLTAAGWSLYEGFLPTEQWEKAQHYAQLSPSHKPCVATTKGGMVGIALAAEFAALIGIHPPQSIPLVETGMVQIPLETARRGLQALEVIRRLDALQDCRVVHWADGLDDLIAALSGTSTQGAVSREGSR